MGLIIIKNKEIHMKKFASLIVLVFALGLVFASCAKKEEPVDPNAPAATEEKKDEATVADAAKDAAKEAAPSKDALKDAAKGVAKDVATKKGGDMLKK